jgi:integrase
MKPKTANQLLIKSAIEPRAQNTGLCDINKDMISNYYTILADVVRRKDLSEQDKAFIECVLLSGARVSSVLKIRPIDIRQGGKVIIRQDKRSDIIIYQPVSLLSYWLKCREFYVIPFYGLSRFYYYRLFRKLGLYGMFEGNNKYSVTHIGRHLQGIVFRDSDLTIVDKKKVLGHKNEKNILYYEKDQKRHK